MRPLWTVVLLIGLSGQVVTAQVASDVHIVLNLNIEVGSHHGWLDWIGVARDGSIATFQPNDQAVRFFAQNGKFRGSVGTKGDGLGGFTRITTAGWFADTLWVSDPAQSRLTLISPRLVPIRTVSTAFTPILPSGDPAPIPNSSSPLPPIPVGLLPSGSILIAAYIDTDVGVPTSWHRPDKANYAYFAIAGSTGVTGPAIAWSPVSTECSARITGIVVTWPLCPASVRTESSDGRLIAFAVPAASGRDSGTYEVTVVGNRGDTVFARRYPFVPRPVSSHVADSVMDGLVSQMRSPSAASILRSYRPKMYPPLASVLIGRDSTIWIELTSTAGRQWLILDAKGGPWGKLIVPSSVRIRVADKANVWAVVTDESTGEVSVSWYHIAH